MKFIFIFSCECTESHLSSVITSSRTVHHQRRSHRRQRHHPSSRLNPHRIHRQTNTAISTVTSYQTDSPTDDEDLSTINSDDTQCLSSQTKLPQPDLVTSIKPTNLNDEYCQHLQHMANLSNQQRLHEQSSETTLPFFGKDDHIIDTQTNELPITILEKNLFF